MDEHAEAIEADFQRYYQTHIGLLGTEQLTWRRFKVLLFRLPRESQYMQTLLGERGRWSTDNHLQATLIDSVNLLRVTYVNAHSKKKAKFESLPRPGVDRTTGDVYGRGGGVTPDEMSARLARPEEVTDG